MEKAVKVDEKKEQLVLVDGHSVLFRAFYAYPSLTTAEGEVVGAVYGFTNILLSAISRLGPEYLALCFDKEEPTFRHEEYEGYKASRPEAPEELVVQQERVFGVIETLNIPQFGVEGYEADDVIGALVKQAVAKRKKNLEVVIVTSDRDLLQLVKDRQVMVWMPGRGKQGERLYDAQAVREKYGLEPEQLVDLKALMGDASDEIPGVKGVGETTAVKLLGQFGSLEGIYKALGVESGEILRRPGLSHLARHAQDDKPALKSLADLSRGKNKKDGMIPERVQRLLIAGRKSAKLSQKLARIVTRVPVKLNLEACRVSGYDKERVIQLFKRLGFKSLIKKLPEDEFEKMIQEELFE